MKIGYLRILLNGYVNRYLPGFSNNTEVSLPLDWQFGGWNPSEQ